MLQFKAGVSPSDVVVTRSGSDLVLAIAGTTDKVTASYFFYGDDPANANNPLQQIKFDNGTNWSIAEIKAAALTGNDTAQTLTGYSTADMITAAGGNDTVSGQAGNDVLDGGAGADYVYGGDGNDTLSGGTDNDTLYGENGNDTLDGGAGNDYLTGGAGNDTYIFARGNGKDTVSDYDTTPGNTDIANFGPDVAYDQLWFRQVGANLEVSIIGTDDKLSLSNWYGSAAYHVEQFKTSDGHMLLDTQVQALVEAMASFAPPAAGQTSLSTDYHASLDTVLAANWR